MDKTREDWIKERAHQLWEQDGEQHGRHEEHWRQAAQEFDELYGGADGGEADGDAGGSGHAKGAASLGSTPKEAVETARDLDPTT